MKLEPLPRLFPFDRAIALSDAVFAVVMTLLVLGIEVPETEGLAGPEVTAAAEKLGHQVLVYFVSFWLVAMYWAHHSLLFASIRQVDRTLVVLNLFMILPVTVLPFVTQLAGSRPGHWGVVVVFAFTNLVAALALLVLWWAVVARPDLHQGPGTLALSKRMRVGLSFFFALLLLGALLALVDVRAGFACFVLLPVVHFYNYLRDPFGKQSPSRDTTPQ